MFYIIRGKGTIGYTDSKEVVDKIINAPWAAIMEYSVEETLVEPKFLDKYI